MIFSDVNNTVNKIKNDEKGIYYLDNLANIHVIQIILFFDLDDF